MIKVNAQDGLQILRTFLGPICSDGKRKSVAEVRCFCGNVFTARVNNIKTGTTKSCGCLKSKILIERNLVHGNTKHPLHQVWTNMKSRCNNKRSDRFACYGGRGIVICIEWQRSFKSFLDWSLSNGYAEGLQIDRINVNGNYEPCNCRFVTPIVNARNKQNAYRVLYNGELHELAQLCDDMRLKYNLVYRRIELLGWSAKDAIEKPSTKKVA